MSAKAIVLARQGQPGAASGTESLSAADPFAGSRSIAFRDEAGFSAGIMALPAGERAFTMPHAEIVVVLAGGLTVTTGAGTLELGAGESIVLPRGLAGTLASAPGTRLAFNAMTLAAASAAPQGLIRLDRAAPRNPSAGPAPEVVVGERPSCHSYNQFTDESGMRAGVWDVTTPCERRFVPHRVHELMHFIEGAVILTHESGERLDLAAGDTVFIPRGAPYAWKSEPAVVKYYVVL